MILEFTPYHAAMLGVAVVSFYVLFTYPFQDKIPRWLRTSAILWIAAWAIPPIAIIYINGVLG